MEGDSEKTKVSYFHCWIDGKGVGKIESWKNKKILISQEEHDRLYKNQREGKYSSEKIESYFTLFESLLAPKSNPLLAVKELHFAKQGFMDSGEFHAHVVKIAKRCKFPNSAIRNKAISLMNEERKELTVESLIQQLEIEDCNTQHKSLSQLDSTMLVNSAAYDHRKNKGKSNKSK